jgi:hypothetical protein
MKAKRKPELSTSMKARHRTCQRSQKPGESLEIYCTTVKGGILTKTKKAFILPCLLQTRLLVGCESRWSFYTRQQQTPHPPGGGSCGGGGRGWGERFSHRLHPSTVRNPPSPHARRSRSEKMSSLDWKGMYNVHRKIHLHCAWYGKYVFCT